MNIHQIVRAGRQTTTIILKSLSFNTATSSSCCFTINNHVNRLYSLFRQTGSTREEKLKALENAQEVLENEKRRFAQETGKLYYGRDTRRKTGSSLDDDDDDSNGVGGRKKRRGASKSVIFAISFMCLMIVTISYLFDLRQDPDEQLEHQQQQQQQPGTINGQVLQYKLWSAVHQINQEREQQLKQQKKDE